MSGRSEGIDTNTVCDRSEGIDTNTVSGRSEGIDTNTVSGRSEGIDTNTVSGRSETVLVSILVYTISVYFQLTGLPSCDSRDSRQQHTPSSKKEDPV